MFVFVGFILLLVLLLLIYFTILSFRKIEIFNNKNKVLAWCISLIPLIIVFSLFNYINAIIIMFHYDIILIIVNLIMLLLKKKNNCVLVSISIILTAIYLSYGAYQAYHIYETKYNINTTKDISNFKIIGISDTHIGTTFNGLGFKKEIEKISQIESDLFVIVGDFIDDNTSKKDMIDACSALNLLHPRYGVYYVNGNHDKGYSNKDYNYDDFVAELEKNNVKILSDEVVNINENVVLVGREDKRYARKSISELISDVDKSKYIIDLNHQPNDYDNESGVVDLVISGHTHGGQLFPFGYIGLWIKANDETYGYNNRKGTNFIVTSGMSGWAMDFKTGTKSLISFLCINGEKNE